MSTTPSEFEVTVRESSGRPMIAVDDDTASLWSTDRSFYSPFIVAISRTASLQDDEREPPRPTAEVLISARPHTAVAKIVDVVVDRLAPDSPEDLAIAAIAAARTAAVDRGASIVKIEAHPGLTALLDGHDRDLEALGFERLGTPLPSIPSTEAPIEGWTSWAGAVARVAGRVPSYYGQTTEFTCGAVAAVTAILSQDRPLFTEEHRDLNRVAELKFWRQATNLPACEPVGLALATLNALAHDSPAGLAPVAVYLSAPGAVLLEGVEGWELGLKRLLQEQSVAEADLLGMAIERNWLDIPAVIDLVAGGQYVLLLITEMPMHNDPAPHWVLAHGVTTLPSGERALVIQDPWVDADHGETWVDADHLVVGASDLDLMVRFGEPAYRGVIAIDAAAL